MTVAGDGVAALDVVYPLRVSGGAHELRFSLRSLRNLPHRNVILCGDLPNWVANVSHIATTRYHTPFVDAQHNILAACYSERVSDPFVLMNDDFFVTRQVSSVPALSRGRMGVVVDVLTRRYGSTHLYVRGMVDTLHELRTRGFDDPHCFEMHAPMVIRKSEFVEAVRMGRGHSVWMYRSVCGALAQLVPDEITPDVKVLGLGDRIPSGPFVSTSDDSFAVGIAGESLRSLFDVASEYER